MSERVSVIVVSRHRPDELRRNLPAFRFQTHRNFELILVADPAGLAAARDLGLSEPLKLVEYDETNISSARNLGLSRAAAPLVAFIDDDATPEPPWLERLTAPFSDQRIVASTGFTRGRNGISYQWKGVATDHTGQDIPLEVPQDEVSLHPPEPGRVVKTHGTNCAFRRADLTRIGGFDPAIRFYLDETDLNHRLVPTGGLTAIVPDAQVHHSYAANATRRADRAPTDLAPIGRSAAIFLRRHCPEPEREEGLNALRRGQSDRLAHHRAKRRLKPAEIDRLMQTLEAGIRDGMSVPQGDIPPLPETPADFLPFAKGPGPSRHEMRGCTLLGYRKALARARADAARGDAVITVLRLSRSTFFHSCRFDGSGVWIQRGGLFGRSERTDPLFHLWRRKARLAREGARVARFRSPDS